MARLGLRASEVLTLELDDILWNVGEIVVRGKGRLHDRLPLLKEVGEAFALYLREARGPSKSRRVFLRHIAPRVGLLQPSIVAKVAREALQCAGLLPRGRVGGHIFRHSLATRMIRHGASLAEIAQVLRDRLMPRLATYVGHGSTVNTYWYIQAVPELLQLATERLEAATRGDVR